MIIRCTRIDRYVFDGYVHSSRVAQEWIREAERQAPWFSVELFADFFFSFYLANPETDAAQEAPPFHRWLVQSLHKQYFYRSLHPRTVSQVGASFKTALKALMWLAESYQDEVKRRQKEQQQLSFGIEKKQRQSGQDEGSLNERLTEKQIEKLRLVGYTLQQGKKTVEEKLAELDAKPLVAEEIRRLKWRIQELKDEMRTEFLKRDKLKAKLKKAEDELRMRERQMEGWLRRDREAVEAIEEELGIWLNNSLKEALSIEDADTLNLNELLQASQRLANRRWGSELGKLRRQQFEQYLQWVEKLKRQPDLLAFLHEVGRYVHRLRVKRKQRRSSRVPEAYDDLLQSGEISRMLPSEASLLAEPEFELYFMVKWLERKLLTYNISGWLEEPHKGPVVCMLDTSHSMRGGKLRLAQIFVATFASFTMLERRDFVLLLFGAKGELVEQTLCHRKPDWPRFYALSQMAFGGGTHFDAPLKRGIEIVRGNPAFHDADFVMVTDGVGYISPDVRGMLGELGRSKQLRLHSLIVGSARQHLIHRYDILGVSHQVRFAATWETRDEAKDELLLDVFSAK